MCVGAGIEVTPFASILKFGECYTVSPERDISLYVKKMRKNKEVYTKSLTDTLTHGASRYKVFSTKGPKKIGLCVSEYFLNQYRYINLKLSFVT